MQRGNQHTGRGRGRGGPNSAGRNADDRQLGGSGEKPKRESIINLETYRNQQIRVKFSGEREIVGTLTGFDPLMNLVLKDVVERKHPNGEESKRQLGQVVVRGPSVLLISPLGHEIPNPFVPR